MTRQPSFKRLPLYRWFRGWPLSAQIIAALAVALLPLGALALAAAVESYNAAQSQQDGLAGRRLRVAARSVQASLDQEFAVLQALLLTDAGSADARQGCDSQLTQVARIDQRIASIVRVDAGGNLLCASAGARLPQVPIGQPVSRRPRPAGAASATLRSSTNPGRAAT